MKITYLIIILLLVLVGILVIPKIINMPEQTQPQIIVNTDVQLQEETLAKLNSEPRLTIIYDNYEYKPELKADWGFACLVEIGEVKVLFDTGTNGEILINNMKALQIDPTSIDTIVLSHDHDDHTGGLARMLAFNHQLEVYLLKNFSAETKQVVKQAGAKLIEIEEFTKINNDLYLSGAMGEEIKEQALIINTPKGLIIITGCAHPGVVKMSADIKRLFNRDILLVLGGFHLLEDDQERIETVISELQKFKIINVAPCHCSGDDARALFKESFGQHYLEVGVGKVIEVKDLLNN